MLRSNLLEKEEKTKIASEIANILLPEQHECGAWDKDEIEKIEMQIFKNSMKFK